MLEFKACPRCGGDLHLSGDRYGRYRECLQCGYLENLSDSAPANKGPAAPETPERVTAA